MRRWKGAGCVRIVLYPRILLLDFVLARPDPVILEYFSKIVTICTGQDKEYEESKGEKLATIMDILAMSEDELLQCTDPRSIRNTCRKVVRVVFKDELSNPKIHFRSVLQQTQKVGAIRGKRRMKRNASDFSFFSLRTTNAPN